MRKFFAGRYYKHQKGNQTLAVIIGNASSGEFVQIIANDTVLQYDTLDGCRVLKHGLVLNYPKIHGIIKYGPFLSLRSPIMGPFHFLPMQCNHEIISMRHSLWGRFLVEDTLMDFSGGTGYIEGDYGRSFPKEYLWLQCNAFKENLSIMVSIAHIPFLGFTFTGCICAITYEGKEYCLATYKGVHIRMATEQKIILTQGHYKLSIRLKPSEALPLYSPKKGQMTATIHESNCTKGSFTFSHKGDVIFHAKSNQCSYEYNY